MTDDITGDLDLLGDWLDAKGYGEEAGLCTRAMDEINKLRAALAAEQERCAKIAEGFEANRDWVPGSLWGNIRREVAAAIRESK